MAGATREPAADPPAEDRLKRECGRPSASPEYHRRMLTGTRSTRGCSGCHERCSSTSPMKRPRRWSGSTPDARRGALPAFAAPRPGEARSTATAIPAPPPLTPRLGPSHGPGGSALEHRGLAGLDDVLAPAHRRCRIHRDHLAGDQPVEQHAHHRQLLLDARRTPCCSCNSFTQAATSNGRMAASVSPCGSHQPKNRLQAPALAGRVWSLLMLAAKIRRSARRPARRRRR